ncbi:hypothetical protein [Methylobacterium sp. Leaf88]|uniref:hypothetical protein n=1 Tax=Methylobacterium sp. Leaf88 TaxID=1736244 RepID=UPI0012E97D37|nr:hypothetical protein [Methylobacterium sp. Leaf88]
MPVTHTFLVQTLGSQRLGTTLSVQALVASSNGPPEGEYHRLIPQGPDPERGAGI